MQCHHLKRCEETSDVLRWDVSVSDFPRLLLKDLISSIPKIRFLPLPWDKLLAGGGVREGIRRHLPAALGMAKVWVKYLVTG